MANAFSKLAPSTASTSRSTKIAATVTPDIKGAIDTFIGLKAKIAALTAEKDTNAQAIREHIQPQQDELAFNGNYNKSFEAAGSKGVVTYTTTDQFSIPQDEEVHAEIKKLVGKELYEEFIEKKEIITLKDSVAKSDKMLNKLAKACEAAGIDIGEYFEKKEKYVSKDDLDANQYRVPKERLPVLRSMLGQYKAAIK